MTDPRLTTFTAETEKVLNFLHTEFGKLQTGRASSSLVEHVPVDSYGAIRPLKNMANVAIEDAKTIKVQPWDKATLAAIEKALTKADLGTSPVNDGICLRIILPPMTEERRKHLVKLVHQMAEEARISIRQLRDKLREELKKEPDEDNRYRLLEQLDEASKKANEQIEQSVKKKEEEVMTI